MAARVWLAVLGLCAGVLSGGEAAIALGLGGSGAALLAARRRPTLVLTGMVLLAAGLGAAASAGQTDPLLARMARRVPACELDGVVLEQSGGLGTLVSARVLHCTTEAVEDAGVLAMELPRAAPGARVRARGWLVPLSDDAFDRARRRAGAGAAFHASEVDLGPIEGLLHRAAAAVRSSLRRATEGFDPARAGLVRGLTIGDTSGLGRADEEALRISGLAHLVAVSGSNVALVLGIVLLAARSLGPAARIGLAAAALTVFVVTVGPDPSVLRAAVMGVVALLALGTGTRADPLAALGMAVLVVVGLRPGMITSVGLQLSVAATAGIVLWTAPLAHAMGRLPAPLSLALGATLAAQAAVAPITGGVFGQLSLAGPLANLAALPAVAPATIMGLLAALVDLAGLPGGGVLGAVSGLAAGWILAVGRYFGGLGWSAVELPAWVGAALGIPVLAAVAVAVARRAEG